MEAEIRKWNTALEEANASGDNYSAVSGAIHFVLDEASKHCSQDVRSKITFLIGPTNAGKSTLLNHLAEQRLKVRVNGRHRYIYPESGVSSVGKGKMSTTLFPTVWSHQQRNVSLVDTAGLFSTSGVVAELIGATISKKLAERATECNFVLVASEASLGPDGTFGKALKDTCCQFFKGNIAAFKDHVSLVVSRCEPVQDRKEYVNGLVSDMLEHCDGGHQEYQELLQHLLNEKRIACFCKPEDGAVENSDYLPPLDQMDDINMIFSVPFKSLPVDSTLLTTGVCPDVTDAMDLAVITVKEKSRAALIEAVRAVLRPMPDVDVADLLNFEVDLDSVKVISDALTLADYISKFNEKRSSCLRKLSLGGLRLCEELDFLGQWRTRRGTLTENWGDCEIKSILQDVCFDIQQIKNYSDCEMRCDEYTMVCSGFVVKMSDVCQQYCSFKQRQEIKEIWIFALHQVIIDSDLTAAGVSLSIIGPCWDVPELHSLDLSGSDETQYPNMKAAADSGSVQGQDGNDGVPGLPGKSGGNFFGLAQTFSNMQNLTIKSNGGNGGPGQKAGDGAKGLEVSSVLKPVCDEKEWSTLAEVDRMPQDELSAKWAEWWACTGVSGSHFRVVKKDVRRQKANRFTGFFPPLISITFTVEVKVDQGKPGGFAGRQGAGGKGGKRGDIRMVRTYKDSEEVVVNSEDQINIVGCTISSTDGGDGAEGGAGNDGENGNGASQMVTISHFRPFMGNETKVKIGSRQDEKSLPCCSRPLRQSIGISNSASIQDPTPPRNNPVSVQRGYLELFLQRNQGLKTFDVLGSAFFSQVRELTSRTTDDISNLLKLVIAYEKYYTNEHRDSFQKHYISLQDIVMKFFRRHKATLSTGQVRVLNFLYSMLCSSQISLTSKSDYLLVIDIQKYFAVVEGEIALREQKVNREYKDMCKSSYQDTISIKIREAEGLIRNLTDDVKKYTKKLDTNTFEFIQELEQSKKDAQKNVRQLNDQKAKLEKALHYKLILGGMNTCCQALGFAGPMAGAVGTLASSFLELGAGFVDGNGGIPSSVHSGLKGLDSILARQAEQEMERIKESLRVMEMTRALNDAAPISDLPPVPTTFPSQGSESIEIPSIPTDGADLEKRLQKLKTNSPTVEELELCADFDDLIKNHDSAHKIRTEDIPRLQERQRLDDESNRRQSELNEEMCFAQKRAERNAVHLRNAAVTASVAKAALDVFKAAQVTKTQIQSLEEAMQRNAAHIQQVEQRIGYMQAWHKRTLGQMKDRIGNIPAELEGHSHATLDMRKWKLKELFCEVGDLLQQFAKGFEAEIHFSNTFRRLQEAIETVISVYERIQTFQEQVNFASYIADLSAGSDIDVPNDFRPEVKQLEKRMQWNIVVAHYNNVSLAFAHWAFPFADQYSRGIQRPESVPAFGDAKAHDVVTKELVQAVSSMKQRVLTGIAVVSEITNVTGFSRFDGCVLPPFHVWSYHQHPYEIECLLSGQEVTLCALLPPKSSWHYQALKFSKIGVQVTCSHPAQSKKLQDMLSSYEVILCHSGVSWYMFGDATYKIESNGNFKESITLVYRYGKEFDANNEHTNETFRSLHDNKPVLSPYTTWKIWLKPLRHDVPALHIGDFQEYPDLKVLLVGLGSYVRQG